MPSVKTLPLKEYLVEYNVTTNTIVPYEGEDKDQYLQKDFKWDNIFTLPNQGAIQDIVNIMVRGCIPPFIPNNQCFTGETIEPYFSPTLAMKYSEVVSKTISPEIRIMRVIENTLVIDREIILEAVKEAEENEVKNKILNPNMGQQLSVDQIQKLIKDNPPKNGVVIPGKNPNKVVSMSDILRK